MNEERSVSVIRSRPIGKEAALRARRNKRKYNVAFDRVRQRTMMVQNARTCGMTRVGGAIEDDFHNVFHRICEDRVTPRW
jgi:hypothetical protein